MVLTGSLWAFFEQNINRLLSYLMIISTGMMLLSIGLNQPSGTYLAVYLVFIRLIAFFVLTWTVFIIQREDTNYSINSLKALFYRSPFVGISTLIAFFTVVGMPLTAGFPVMQSIYAFLSAENRWLNFNVILSSGFISIIFIRLSFMIFSQKRETNQKQIPISSMEKVFCGFFILLLVVSGLFPSVFLTGFEGTVNGFEFLVK